MKLRGSNDFTGTLITIEKYSKVFKGLIGIGMAFNALRKCIEGQWNGQSNRIVLN